MMFTVQKQQLEGLQAELENRLSRLQRDLSASHSSDSSEQAVERENDEVLEQLKMETEQELLHIKRALKRIEQGEYGICENCGATINPQRLEALPYTTVCIQCAE